jgi:hypothetical protein
LDKPESIKFSEHSKTLYIYIYCDVTACLFFQILYPEFSALLSLYHSTAEGFFHEIVKVSNMHDFCFGLKTIIIMKCFRCKYMYVDIYCKLFKIDVFFLWIWVFFVHVVAEWMFEIHVEEIWCKYDVDMELKF